MIKEAKIDLKNESNSFVNPNIQFDKTRFPFLFSEFKLSISLPTKISVDLSLLGITLPEGTNINFSMTDNFAVESFSGSNQMPLPPVNNFLQFKTPKQFIISTESEFTQAVEYRRFRDNGIEADALFTPAFVAVATKVGEIQMSAAASQESDVNYIAAGVSSQTAEFDAEPLATRIFQLFPQQQTAQFNSEINGGYLRLPIVNAISQTTLDAEGVKFPGIADENLTASSELDIVFERFRSTVVEIESVANQTTDTLNSTTRDNNIQQNATFVFDVGRITDYPFDLQTAVTLEDAPASFSDLRVFPSKQAFYAVYERNDGLYNLEAWSYAGLRLYSNIGYTQDDDTNNLPNWTGPFNAVNETFMIYDEFSNGFNVWNRPGLGLIDPNVPIGITKTDYWLAAEASRDQPNFYGFDVRNISGHNNQVQSVVIEEIEWDPFSEEYQSQSTIIPDFTNTNGTYTSEWGEIYIINSHSTSATIVAEIIFKEVGTNTVSYREVHFVRITNAGYNIQFRATSRTFAESPTKTEDLFDVTIARTTENENDYWALKNSNGEVVIYDGPSDFITRNTGQSEVVLENNHYFYQLGNKIKTINIDSNQPIQTITGDYNLLTASNAPNAAYVLFYDSDTNEIKIHRDIR